jgi:hypothetical protein
MYIKMCRKFQAIGKLGYLAKYEKIVEGKVVANYVFLISSVGIFYVGRAVMASHSLH